MRKYKFVFSAILSASALALYLYRKGTDSFYSPNKLQQLEDKFRPHQNSMHAAYEDFQKWRKQFELKKQELLLTPPISHEGGETVEFPYGKYQGEVKVI